MNEKRQGIEKIAENQIKQKMRTLITLNIREDVLHEASAYPTVSRNLDAVESKQASSRTHGGPMLVQ